MNKPKKQEPRTRVQRRLEEKKNSKREDIRTNKNSKKNSSIISILFIILVISIIGVFFVISIGNKKDTDGYFVKEEKNNATTLFNKIISISEENYPKTPEDVVTIYTDGYKLLYGEKIKDLSIVPTILQKQRILLSDEILNKNPADEQQKNVYASIENLKKNKVKLTNVVVKPVMYDTKDENLAYVRVEQKDNLFQTYYYIYHLQKSLDGKWRISGWYNTDADYNIIKKEDK